MPLIQYPGDKEPCSYTDEEKEAIDELYSEMLHREDIHIKCVRACVDILDLNCVSPTRICAACRKRDECNVSVKLAHHAICSVFFGTNDTLNRSKWYALVKWRNTNERRTET